MSSASFSQRLVACSCRAAASVAVAVALLVGCGRSDPGQGEGATWAADAEVSLEVEVVDAGSGDPLAGAWVVLTPGGRDARTDEVGVARFGRLDPGDYALAVRVDGRAAILAGSDAVEVAASSVSTRVEVEVPAPPGGALAVRVVDHQGPVVGATVVIDEVEQAVTDGEGTARVPVPEGPHRVELRPPVGAPLMPWSSPEVVVRGGDVLVATRLPGLPPAGTAPVGDARCGDCHAVHLERFADSPHARAAAPPDALGPSLAGLAQALASGESVALSNGAIVRPGPATLDIVDASGAGTGPLAVVEVYGGHRAGAALAVQTASGLAVAPVAWALDGAGLSSLQAEAGWVELALDAWFDVDGGLRAEPEPSARFDAACAGCHGGDFTLAEDTPGWPDLRGARAMGCETCHGPGEAHASRGDAGAIHHPAHLPAWRAFEGCARCHERVDDDTHPFSVSPGLALTDDGAALAVDALVAAEAVPDHLTWRAVDASRVPHDQAGDFRTSPHRGGAGGYDGRCVDCHDPHTAGLRVEGNGLCTTCHATRFPDADAEATHAGHRRFAPGPWSPGGCTSCHLPRSGTILRPDAVSGAGESRAHTLWPWRPDDALAEFDAAGTDTLPLGQVPVGACVDCHLQNDALLEDDGGECACPTGDPTRRITWQNQQAAWDLLFGGTP